MTMIGRMLILALALAGVLPALADPAEEKWTLWTTTAKEMWQAGRTDEAEMAFKQLIKVSEAFPPEDKRASDSYVLLACCYLMANQPIDGVEAMLLARLEKEYGAKDPRVIGFLLAAAKTDYDNLPPGRDYLLGHNLSCRYFFYHCALTVREKEIGAEDPALVDILTGLAYNSLQQEERRAYFQRAVAILDKAYGFDDPRIIPPLSRLADAVRDGEFPVEAAAIYQRVRDVEDAALWPDDPRVFETLGKQAIFYRRYQAHYPEDILLQQRRIGWLARTGLEIVAYYDEENTHGFLARDYQRLGYYDEALTEMARPSRHPYDVYSERAKTLGDMMMAWGRYAEAETYYRQWVAQTETRLAKLSKKDDGGEAFTQYAFNRIEWLIDLGACLDAQGKTNEAAEVSARAKTMLQQSDLHGNVNLYSRVTGRRFRDDPYDEYIYDSLWRHARESERANGLHLEFTAEQYQKLARYCMDTAHPAQAEAPLQRVVDIWEGMLGPRHRRLVHPLAELAACKAALGKKDEAEGLYRRAVGIAEGAYGAGDTLTVMIRGQYEKGKKQ